MFTIRKRFTFAAAHQLAHLPSGHQCARLHGHNYVIWLELSSPAVDADGFVRDFGELKPFRNYLDSTLDHRFLNEILDFHTTAENLARHLYSVASGMWAETIAVAVEETETSWAEFRP